MSLRPFYLLQDELRMSDNEPSCLWRGDRLLVPQSLRAAVLTLAHEGYLSIVKTKERCCDFVWWPGMDQQVKDLVRSCESSGVSEKSALAHTATVAPRAWPAGPWQSLQVDLFGELRDAVQAFRFLLVVHDRFSKWPEVVSGHQFWASDVVSALSSLFALPVENITDNGP